MIMLRPPEEGDVADREEALALLTAQARSGSVTASIALARELRGDQADTGDPLEALLRAK
jgi:hypothetical protein